MRIERAATMLPMLVLLIASHVVSLGPSNCCNIKPWGGTHESWAPLRLRGGGRAWIRKTVKAASKKERQRKKRNIDSTNLRASVKLDSNAVPPGLLLKNELDNQAELWLRGGCCPGKIFSEKQRYVKSLLCTRTKELNAANFGRGTSNSRTAQGHR